MRLTRDILLKIARDTAQQRVKISRRIICIYLTGSTLSQTPLLGGTTDIDLVIVHDSEPSQQREIVRLSDDVHLDISHYPQSMFHQPRHLRADPWLGPFLYAKPLVLHDTQHWFDYAQAATGAQFFQPENILARSAALAQLARQGWMRLQLDSDMAHPRRVYQFLQVLENAGNALVSLGGEPLTERRFFLQLAQRLQSLNQLPLLGGLVHLLAAEEASWQEQWQTWLPGWQADFHAAQPNTLPRLQPARWRYYESAATALWEENPVASLWPMLRSWALAVSHLPEGTQAHTAWQSALRSLQLDPQQFEEKTSTLDHYLDQVEEALDQWASANGLSGGVSQYS